MIGVLAKTGEAEVVREFFELYKTPWEFYKEHAMYDVVLATCDHEGYINTSLLVIYDSEENAFDRTHKLTLSRVTKASVLQHRELPVPIYGPLSTFRQDNARAVLRTMETDDVVAVFLQTTHGPAIRIGFDLFQEVKHLLSDGQTLPYAPIPTLDMHSAMLRDWIVGSCMPLVEVLSRPAGYDFTVCLTHDIDFLRIRDHTFDHTMFGFLYRAIFRSFGSFLRGNLSFGKLLRNWAAVCLLPGVYLGLIKDYFFQFDKYLEVEKDLISTFFIIPFKNRPGKDKSGKIHRARAVRYDINDIEPEIKKLMSAGREIALHGIDAWCDPVKGREELQRIARITGDANIGTRSHWLYQYEQSPQHLEEAGFVYDSSVGYNETIGYRSGTTQVFRPFGATKLLELPLHIMDTTLFYTGRMDLPESQAMALVEGMIATTQRFGGVLTINWHDRSMGPERLWDTFYESILARLKGMKVWFATVSQAISWFSVRRSVSFHEVRCYDNTLQVKLSSSSCANPPLVLRVHLPRQQGAQADELLPIHGRIIDIAFSGDLEISISL